MASPNRSEVFGDVTGRNGRGLLLGGMGQTATQPGAGQRTATLTAFHSQSGKNINWQKAESKLNLGQVIIFMP